MAVDSQWSNVVCMLPLSVDFSDARGNAASAGPQTVIVDTVGDPFGAGNAAYFSGVAFGPNYSGLSVSAYSSLGGNFSLEMAFWPELGGHGSSDSVLIQIGADGVSGSLRVICNGSSDPAQLRVQRDAGTGWADLITFVATDVTSDDWHWLQLDRVTNTFTLWIDGVQYSTATVAASLGNQDVHIGHNGASQYRFRGYVAQVRVTDGAYRATHAVPTAPWPRPTITGTVLDVLGMPVSRVIRAIPRAQAVQAISDPVTGAYTAYPTTYDQHIVIRIDTDDDPPVDGVGGENAMVFDRITPGG